MTDRPPYPPPPAAWPAAPDAAPSPPGGWSAAPLYPPPAFAPPPPPSGSNTWKVVLIALLAAGGVIVLSVVALVAFVILPSASRAQTRAAGPSTVRLEAAAAAAGGTLDNRFDPGVYHEASPLYEVDPPAGGNHASRPAAPGDYPLASAPTDGAVVHSLEHGYVAVWYRPDLDPDDLAALRDVLATYPRDVLLIARPSLATGPTPVAATAWHHRLLLPSPPDAKAVLEFVRTYRNQGPERIRH
jgi:hypothetical protein